MQCGCVGCAKPAQAIWAGWGYWGKNASSQLKPQSPSELTWLDWLKFRLTKLKLGRLLLKHSDNRVENCIPPLTIPLGRLLRRKCIVTGWTQTTILSWIAWRLDWGPLHIADEAATKLQLNCSQMWFLNNLFLKTWMMANGKDVGPELKGDIWRGWR